MNSKTESITITFSRKEGLEVRNQILGLVKKCKKDLHFDKDLKDSPLKNLFTLLGGNFESSVSQVHFLNR